MIAGRYRFCVFVAALLVAGAARLESRAGPLPPLWAGWQRPGRTPGLKPGLLRPQPAAHQQPNPDRPADARDGIFQKLSFQATWLDAGTAQGFGVSHMELETLLAFAVPSRRWPVTLAPRFAVRYLDGPVGADLPPRVYDAAVQLRWWRRLWPRLGVDLAIAPGLFSDFQQGSDEALRIPGHAVGVFDCTPRLKILFGVAYLDRQDVGVLPVGGLIWTPHQDVKFELTVPRPRIARRIYWPGACTDQVQDWVYVAGQFGGGTWAIRRQAGSRDLFTYRDFRLILGIQRKAIGRLDRQLELGYVFSREIQYASHTPDLSPADTVMLRAILAY